MTMNVADGFIIYAADPARKEDACKLASRTGAAVTDDEDEAARARVCLRFDGGWTVLCGSGMEIRDDLSRMIRRVSAANLNSELLIRAAKPKKSGETLTCIDATAGFGEDALLLAAAGFSVTLCERDPVIAALLKSGLENAAGVPELSAAVSRMTAVECDSMDYMRSCAEAPDVVLLDPMFPARKKSGLIKKKLQLIQMLEEPCGDEEGLLSAALSLRPGKIVVKRPAKGAYLAGRKPDYSVFGNSVRYDCMIPHMTN